MHSQKRFLCFFCGASVPIMNGHTTVKVVKQRSGGGTKFINLPRDATLIEVRDKAREIFPTGENFFGEEKDNLEFAILNASEEAVDLEDMVSTYLDEKGLFPSQTWFISDRVQEPVK